MELLVAIAVVTILITLGVPSLQQVMRDNRVSAQTNELTSLVSYARSQATQASSKITLDITTSGSTWSAVVKNEGCAPNPCELRSVEGEDVELGSDGTFPIQLEFNSRGVLATGSESLSLQHVPCSGSRQRRELDILISGAVRAVTAECSKGAG